MPGINRHQKRKDLQYAPAGKLGSRSLHFRCRLIPGTMCPRGEDIFHKYNTAFFPAFTFSPDFVPYPFSVLKNIYITVTENAFERVQNISFP